MEYGSPIGSNSFLEALKKGLSFELSHKFKLNTQTQKSAS